MSVYIYVNSIDRHKERSIENRSIENDKWLEYGTIKNTTKLRRFSSLKLINLNSFRIPITLSSCEFGNIRHLLSIVFVFFFLFFSFKFEIYGITSVPFNAIISSLRFSNFSSKSNTI